ncbi:MAG: acetyl-CoA carboxylase biotin carboxyl carrier protein [Myxacorys californica WJT36-NPBG1]|nr:acetyl-CoA carboxylase biotin carboxyl carrier protein [Myxacorys californica WJT36-NPBG1]
MPLDLKELRELLADLNQTDISELTLKSSDFELTVRRGAAHEASSAIRDLNGTVPSPVNLNPAPAMAPPPPDAPRLMEPPPFAPPHERRLAEVTSPMVGTFYRSPGPDEPPFVQVGDRIRLGQTVCIVEAMKLMNELESEVSGEVVEILVQNGDPVEFGQPLMRVNPG